MNLKHFFKKIPLKNQKNKILLNSLEGYIRQLIEGREFVRGIYQNFSDEMYKNKLFNLKSKMRQTWYNGNTSLIPSDYSIKNALKFAWSHHIERLMIISSIMNLCEINPKNVYAWFMEMYAVSSEWVMYPDVLEWVCLVMEEYFPLIHMFLDQVIF